MVLYWPNASCEATRSPFSSSVTLTSASDALLIWWRCTALEAVGTDKPARGSVRGSRGYDRLVLLGRDSTALSLAILSAILENEAIVESRLSTAGHV